MAETTAAYKIIGTRPLRPDGADKVTGRALYGADMHMTGMLYGKVLRSPHAHARIIVGEFPLPSQSGVPPTSVYRFGLHGQPTTQASYSPPLFPYHCG